LSDQPRTDYCERGWDLISAAFVSQFLRYFC
jgi:hypothetical protein